MLEGGLRDGRGVASLAVRRGLAVFKNTGKAGVAQALVSRICHLLR